MDPISIATSVVSLCGICLVTVKRLGDVASKFKDASKILLDVSSEAKIIELSLSQLHNTLVSDESSILGQALLTPDIRDALDISLTGCKVTLSCIEDEISSLTAKIRSDQRLNVTDRAKVVWKDSKFKELLKRLREQYKAIAILQQGFQSKALADILPLLQSQRATIQEVAEGTRSLRGLYPDVDVAKSFLESSEPKSESESGDERTYSMASMVSEKKFPFDDEVTSSQVYRRILIAAAHTLKSTKSGNVLPNRESSEKFLDRADSKEEGNIAETHSANQARKISPSAPPRKGLPPTISTEIHVGTALNMTTAHSDPFLQQPRGYNDPLEGELLDATNMTMNFLETVNQKDYEIQRLESDFQNSVEKVRRTELQLEQYLTMERQHAAVHQTEVKRLQAEVDKYRNMYDGAFADSCSVRVVLEAREAKIKTLELDLNTSKGEIKAAREEAQRHEGERAEMARKIESELRISFDAQQMLQKIRDELLYSERNLVSTRQQRDSLQERLNFSKGQSQQLFKESKDELLYIEKKLVAIRQKRDTLEKEWDFTRLQSQHLLKESNDELYKAKIKLTVAQQERDFIQESLTSTANQLRGMLQEKEEDHKAEFTRLEQQISDAEALAWADSHHRTTLLYCIIALSVGLIVTMTVWPSTETQRNLDVNMSQGPGTLYSIGNSDYMTGFDNHSQIETRKTLPPHPLPWVSNGMLGAIVKNYQ